MMTAPTSRTDRRREERKRRQAEELAEVIAAACPDGRRLHPRVLAAILIEAGYSRPVPQQPRAPRRPKQAS